MGEERTTRARSLRALAGLALVGGVAGTAWRLGLLATDRSCAEARIDEPAVGALLPLEPFIANLGDQTGERYLKATLQLEVFGARVPDELTARLPQIRDGLLTLLTSKLFAEIRTPEGKAVLRDEIVNRVNRTLGRDLVKAVYFTEFIVQ
jgi:flagellar protein FliL